MPKLSTLKPLVSNQAPMVATMRDTRDTAAGANVALYRTWYKSARWQRLRMEVLTRDLYTCQQTGIILAGKANAPDSPVVDHKVPHRGDPVLFWDITNLQAVSKAWHDSTKQSEERAADTAVLRG